MSPGRAEQVAAGCFIASVVASIALAIVYWQGGHTQAEGALLAVILGGIGLGIVVWAKRFMDADEAVEERGPLASPEDDVAAFTADFEAGEEVLRRRRVLLALGGAALAALGAALLFPIRSLGPRPGRGLKVTQFRGGRRVVTADGEPVQPADIAVDGVITVWPEGYVDSADSPALLIHLREEHDFQPRPGRDDWTVSGIVAYSKICTHTGCPVGLYQSEDALLLCPCHQSTFDVLDGAEPIFGPAARPLPQLPLGVDADGFIISQGDFSGPTGPGFWDRGR